jgi:nucleoside-diphosphate-sugar epimerase
MQKILISGYTGFIGTNITRFLGENILYGVDIVQKDSVSRHYTWEALDECNVIDCIIHLAGKAHDTKNTTSEKEYFDINVGLTQKIFHHFLKSEATKFIFFSSVKAVADSVKGEYLTEEDLPNPQTPYGKSKLEAEKYILDQSLPFDKKVYILRPCMIHGPGNKGNLNLLFKIQQKGLPWPLGAFENKRSFCSVDNLLFVIQKLVEKNIEPGIYQLADDEALSTNELISLMAASQNKKARIWNIPAGLIESLASLGGILHLPLNKERLKKLTESYMVSNQKIKQALGIEKMPVTAEEGLVKTFQSFKKK